MGGTLSSRILNLGYLGPKISKFYRLGNVVSCIASGTFILGKKIHGVHIYVVPIVYLDITQW